MLRDAGPSRPSLVLASTPSHVKDTSHEPRDRSTATSGAAAWTAAMEEADDEPWPLHPDGALLEPHDGSPQSAPELARSDPRQLLPETSTAKLLTTQAAAAATKDQAEYPESPEKCRHESGVRQYGAAGLTISICDRCGSRWALNPELRQWAIARPKASPAARTPLGINFHKS